jgi:hypothetical protein
MADSFSGQADRVIVDHKGCQSEIQPWVNGIWLDCDLQAHDDTVDHCSRGAGWTLTWKDTGEWTKVMHHDEL